MLIASGVGVGTDGKRSVLGVSTALSEAEVHGREFFSSLVARGLCGTRFIVSDAHPGMAWPPLARPSFPPSPGSAAISISSKTPQLTSLASKCVRKWPDALVGMKQGPHRRPIPLCFGGSIFHSPDLLSAQARLKERVGCYAKSAPKLAAGMEQNLPEGFAGYALTSAHQRRRRTSNAIERVNQELKRRTRVAFLIPKEAFLQRLVSALLCEQNDEGFTSKIDLNMNPAHPLLA